MDVIQHRQPRVSSYKRCPYCNEKLLAAAVKCPHCKSRFSKSKPKNTCKDCPAQIAATAERCKKCYKAYRKRRSAERQASDDALQRSARDAQQAADAAQRAADTAAQMVADRKAERAAEASRIAEENKQKEQAADKARRAKRLAAISVPRKCVYFLQSAENPNRWVEVRRTTLLVGEEGSYTNNRIVVSFTDEGYRVDVIANNIEPAALLAGLRATGLSEYQQT